MRKAKPSSVRDDFLSALRDLETTHTSVDASALTATSKRLVAEQNLMAAAVLWEGYLSDLFVAYINVDLTAFRDQLLRRIQLSATDSADQDLEAFARRALKLGYVEKKFTKNHLTVAELRKVLDEQGWNVTFDSIAHLKKFAGLLLGAPQRGYFTGISTAQAATIGAWRALRNFLAHRSRGAKDTMHAALRETSLASHLKISAGRSIDDVGYHLTKVLVGVPADRRTRLLYYLTEMRLLATALCP